MEQTPQPSKPAQSAPKSKKTMYGIVGAIVIIIVVVAALYFAGIFGGGGPGTPATIYDTGSCTNASNCDFAPSPLNLSVNTKVTWTSNSTRPHTVTACSSANAPDTTSCPTMNASGLPSFDSGSGGISKGQTYSYTFSTAGNYYYYCRFHNWMHGQVNVT